MFTILAGPDLKKFSIHKDLLAGVSEEMQRHVCNDMKEGLEGRVEMKEVSEETMTYFIEFCYYGNYTPCQTWDCYVNRTEDPVASLDYLQSAMIAQGQEAVLAHARLYVFAEIYNINALRDLSMKNLKEIMEQFEDPDIFTTSSIVCLVEYVLEHIPERLTTDPLVALLAKCTAWGIREPSGGDQISALLASVDRKDFFDIFRQNVTSDVSTPWAQKNSARQVRH
jgi:hypothetical protein